MPGFGPITSSYTIRGHFFLIQKRWNQDSLRSGCLPIGSMVLLYMVTFTMLAYIHIQYIIPAPWILWLIVAWQVPESLHRKITTFRAWDSWRCSPAVAGSLAPTRPAPGRTRHPLEGSNHMDFMISWTSYSKQIGLVWDYNGFEWDYHGSIS